MLCSVYTTIAGEYDGPGFCTPIGRRWFQEISISMLCSVIYGIARELICKVYS